MATLKNTTIDGTGALGIPRGNASQRPSSPSPRQIRFNTETGTVEQYRNGVDDWLPVSNTGVIATGGDAVYDVNTEGTTYRVHVFTSTGTSTFSVLQGGQVEYLIVAGGGGGGGSAGGSAGGGGGGAGGLLLGKLEISTGNYGIEIGSGGAGGKSSSDDAGDNGSNSTAFGLAADGGGGGGTRGANIVTAKDGGSGGGAGSHNNSRGGLGTSGQGNNGGSDLEELQAGDNPGAGGGGAGGSGSDTPSSLGPAGPGGVGITSFITGTETFYAGGGGGGRRNSPSNISGGLGGGGFGSGTQNVQPANGTPNTGGGGGGCPNSTVGGANGGSGIVVIRYPLRQNNPEAAAGKIVNDGVMLDIDFSDPLCFSGGSGSQIPFYDSRLSGFEGVLVDEPKFDYPRTHRSSIDFFNTTTRGGVYDVTIPRANKFACTVWFSPDQLQTGNYQYILHHHDGTVDSLSNSTFFVALDLDNKIWATLGSRNGAEDDDGFTPSFASGDTSVVAEVGKWYNLTLTWDGTNASVYLNGTLRKSYTVTINDKITSTLDMSGTLYSVDRSFIGKIAAFKIYDRSLSEEEILQYYNATRWRFGV